MKIITAIGDRYINDKLREKEDIEVVGKDIQYQEGILEILEEIKNIDLLILSNNILGEYNFSILINKIEKLNKKLNLIIFLKEKNIDIENYLNSKKIYKIYYLNKENFDIFLNSFYKNNFKKNLEKEIKDFKKIILKNNQIDLKNNENKISKSKVKNMNSNTKKYIKNYKINTKKYKKIHNKTIVITGNYGSGKSIVSTILSRVLSNKNKTVLLIDFDIFNNTINTILGINKYPKNFNKINYKSLIIKRNKYLNVFCGIDIYFNEQKEIETELLNNILNKLKKEYEYIILDLSSNINYKFIKTILVSSNKIIFLLEPNLIEIKKANNILEIFLNDFNLDVDKIKIIFNKTNKYKIAECILEEVFSKFEIIGDIKYDEKYNLLINNKKFESIDNKEYEKICSNL